MTSHTIEQLEFSDILERVVAHAKGHGAIARINQLHIPPDVQSLRQKILPTVDCKAMISEGLLWDLYPYEEILKDLDLLQKKNYVLDVEAVIKIAGVLENYQIWHDHFTPSLQHEYAHIYQLGQIDHYTPHVLQDIRQVFDTDGSIREDASPILKKIYQHIEATRKSLNRQFDVILARYQKANLLHDTAESIKNGRRVLVLPVEHKRKINGVIQDQSGSGKTVYIEPQEMAVLNNELYSLDNDLRAEVYRILSALSEQLRQVLPMIRACYDRIIELDSVRAKAIFSNEISGILPKINPSPGLHLLDAHHPLLLLKELDGHPKTVSFSVDLKYNNRIVLISGPNAGGKSVTLKAVGLLHLMIYHGILIPVHEDSKISLFSKIYTDIGDHQSIDEGLSTYSSHLKNLKDILDAADDRSLVLLDEIGSGTDPKLGGAIAEGIIRGLLAKRCLGIITTHYSELKVFAFRHKGIVNGAMLFDKEHLLPTYKLKVGQPGSSYAFEVAKKVGLDQRVIRYAKKKVGKKENHIEDLLIDLQEQKSILDDQLQWLDNERVHLDKLIINYETLAQEFQVKRKKLKIRSKEIELKKANDESQELQELINKLEKEKNLEKLKQRKSEIRQQRRQEADHILALKKEIIAEKNEDETLVVGDFVRMIDGDISGELMAINGDKAKVLFGIMPMEVPLADITKSQPQLQINAKKGINVKGVSLNQNFTPKLDIRGYSPSDAGETLDLFFDQALLSNARTLEIVHGKGAGVLRNLVISKMKEYKDLTSYHHPDDDQGGNGVTIIKM